MTWKKEHTENSRAAAAAAVVVATTTNVELIVVYTSDKKANLRNDQVCVWVRAVRFMLTCNTPTRSSICVPEYKLSASFFITTSLSLPRSLSFIALL